MGEAETILRLVLQLSLVKNLEQLTYITQFHFSIPQFSSFTATLGMKSFQSLSL